MKNRIPIRRIRVLYHFFATFVLNPRSTKSCPVLGQGGEARSPVVVLFENTGTVTSFYVYTKNWLLSPGFPGLAALPWEYPWSSAAAHCGTGDDPSRMLDLGRWFEQTSTSDWKKTLEGVADSDRIIERLRQHSRTGRPLGDERFLEWIEEALGRVVRPKAGGRPQGSKDKSSRKTRNSGPRREAKLP